jgi:DNA-directed RNA polymerase specialized sigma24 family protein
VTAIAVPLARPPPDDLPISGKGPQHSVSAVSDLDGFTRDELVAAVRRVESDRQESIRLSGQMLAALHDTHGLSWPAIAKLTGITQSTAHRRAQRYLVDPGTET